MPTRAHEVRVDRALAALRVAHQQARPALPAEHGALQVVLIGRLLSRQDLDSEPEIAAESLADRLAAGIRGAMFAESAYSEVFG